MHRNESDVEEYLVSFFQSCRACLTVMQRQRYAWPCCSPVLNYLGWTVVEEVTYRFFNRAGACLALHASRRLHDVERAKMHVGWLGFSLL